MPPAGLTPHAQLGLLQQTQIPFTTSDKIYFNDTPTLDGKLKLSKVLQSAHAISRGGSSLGINIEGNDPGNAAGATPTQVAQRADRDTASFHYMIRLCCSHHAS